MPVARKLFAEHKTLVASSDVLALENERLLDENTSLLVACTLLAFWPTRSLWVCGF